MAFRRAIYFTVLTVLSLVCTVNSQTVDTGFLGVVMDGSGAVIPGAIVSIASTATGFSKTVVTGAQGEYEVRYLKPGIYGLKVTAQGFAVQSHAGVVLQLGQQGKLDFKLGAAGTQQVVEVQGTQPLLQSENASLGAVIGPERTQNLQLNGRKFNDLALLTPGVSVYNPDLHSSSTDGTTISSNGGRSTWGQINVDGITMVNNRHAYVNLYPSIDAIQEFQVLIGNYSAQYGGGAGTNVIIQLKSGTNTFHGNAFEFIRNDAVDARNYFIPSPIPKNVLKQNQFGVTFGGPLVKDRTFFFFSYEGLRSVQDFPSTAQVLTADQRAGDFSAQATFQNGECTSGCITDPLVDTTENPDADNKFPGNKIPTDRINTVSKNIIDTYMPLPNIPANGGINYAGSSQGKLSVNQYLARVDHRINDKNQLFLHYIYAKRNFPDTELNPNFHFTGTYPIHNIALQYLHVFSPSLLNELRVGADLEHVKQLSIRTGTDFTIESLGINGFKVGGPNGRPLNPNEEGFPLLEISGYLGIGDDLAASNLDDSRTYQLVDNATWTRGKHTVIFGVDLRHVQDNATTNNTPFGEMDFTGDIAGDQAAAFMLGYPKTSTTPEGVPITKARQWKTAEFVQDNWKATPKLTLNLGLRYDIYAAPVDINHVSRTLDFRTSPPTFIPAVGDSLGGLWSITYKDFGPRLGFAYSVTPSMVIRGGYGLTYYGGQFDNINILQLNPPTAGSLTISNSNELPPATIQNPVPAVLYPDPPYFNAVTLPADRKRPDLRLQTYNLTVSKQFGSNVLDVSYVGAQGGNIDSSIKNFNSPTPGPGAIQQRRPYNTFARIRYQDFSGSSNYNALQTHFEHRLTRGLSLTTAYTWSHELDNQAWDTNGGGCGCQDPRHPHEYASGTTDQRHNLAIGYVWALPSAKMNSLLSSFINGWTLNGLALIASGNPYDVMEGNDTQNTDSLWERPDRVAGQKLTVSNRSINAWFNTAAFTDPAPYTFGNSTRNPLVAPATRAVNLAVMKDFPIPFSEAQRLQVRFEAFNALNNPQWATPDSTLGDDSFGQVTSTAINNRELQLALKYFF